LSNGRSHFHSTGDPPARAIFMLAQVYLAPRVFVHIGEEIRLPSRMEAAVFRLVQESVQNALKHAEARHIDVKMEVTCHHLLVSVKDDGKGFDPSVKKENAFGLIGMRERVELLGGTLDIRSKIGSGTTVFIRVPLDRSTDKTNKEERKR
ncbi:sensor histidine kinase, partial [Geobacillus thermoleovorans]|uniref:sensor histidine kinase n=1 Tax=Geobacillus thermoleovorans TaxID=33941 RepID=UPI0020787EF2